MLAPLASSSSVTPVDGSSPWHPRSRSPGSGDGLDLLRGGWPQRPHDRGRRSMNESIARSLARDEWTHGRVRPGHHATIVHGMNWSRARILRVAVGDGQTERQALRLCTHHSAGGRTMPIQPITLAPERSGRAEWLAVDDIGDAGTPSRRRGWREPSRDRSGRARGGGGGGHGISIGDAVSPT